MAVDPNQFAGMIAPEDVLFLQEHARSAPEGAIVEIGAYRGRSAISLALGAKQRATTHNPLVYSIEPHATFVGVYGGRFGSQDRAAYYKAISDAGLGEEIALVALPSVQASKGWTARIGLLFIDGDHTLEGVRADVEAWLPFLAPGGVVVFDDAADPNIGPFVVIAELLESGLFERAGETQKMRALRRRQPRSPFLDQDEPTAAEIVRRLIDGSEYPDGITQQDVLAEVDWRALYMADFDDGYSRSVTYTRVHAEALARARARKAN